MDILLIIVGLAVFITALSLGISYIRSRTIPKKECTIIGGHNLPKSIGRFPLGDREFLDTPLNLSLYSALDFGIFYIEQEWENPPPRFPILSQQLFLAHGMLYTFPDTIPVLFYTKEDQLTEALVYLKPDTGGMITVICTGKILNGIGTIGPVKTISASYTLGNSRTFIDIFIVRVYPGALLVTENPVYSDVTRPIWFRGFGKPRSRKNYIDFRSLTTRPMRVNHYLNIQRLLDKPILEQQESVKKRYPVTD